MKTKGQLYHRESVILIPRVVLKASSQSGSQDLLAQEARSSWESQEDAESYGETRSNTADCRITGISISTVKLQDARRHNFVTKLIEMLEKHPHKEQFTKRHESKKQKINTFRVTKITRRYESSKFARILHNFNVLIATLLRKSGSFIAVAGEI